MSFVVRLSKLHATGNDFLVAVGDAGFHADTARRLCDRHRGIGADGLIQLGPGVQGADCSMILQNSDGGFAEMSGNGIRCLAWVAHREGFGDGKRLVVETRGGQRQVDLELDSQGNVAAATVDMGPATFGDLDLAIAVDGAEYVGDVVNVGNPHYVLLVDPTTAPVTLHGPLLERDLNFPQRTNVEFVAVTGHDELLMRVWERGAGETLSCGTGACAAAASAHRRGLVGDDVKVCVFGGDLRVELGETVRLGGPVQHVFDVEIDVDEFVKRTA